MPQPHMSASHRRAATPAPASAEHAAPTLLHRAATLAGSSYNAETRRLELTWSTGARVTRYGLQGLYEEELSLDPEAVDLDRLNSGSAPLLNAHNSYSLAGQIGAVERAWITGGEGRAIVRLSGRDELEGLRRDLAEGMRFSVSVGYRVQRYQIEERSDGPAIYTAIEWEPYEISLVPIPADPGAQTRGVTMPHPNPRPAPAAAPAPAAPMTREAIQSFVDGMFQSQLQPERGLAGSPVNLVDDLVCAGADEITVRRTVQDVIAERSAHAGGPGYQRIHALPGDRRGGDSVIEDMSAALAHRLLPSIPLAERARQYAGMPLLDMARSCLEALGRPARSRDTRDMVFTEAMRTRGNPGYHTTGDFPALLSSTGERVLRAAYDVAASPLKAVSRQSTATDFRAKSTVQLGSMGRLKKVRESGELQYGTRTEAAETYRLETFGLVFALTRQALINDDLGAFGDFTIEAGRSAARTEADELAALLLGNPVMSDGTALFHATHGNLGTAAAINTTSLSAARQAMRTQKGVGADAPVIGVAPKYLLVGPAKETEGETMLAQIAAATTGDVNVFSGKLELLVEPRITGNQWFVFADPAQAPVLEYAHLSGEEGPQISDRDGWEVLGREFRVVLDFGCGVIDWRGGFRNPGA